MIYSSETIQHHTTIEILYGTT
ncbi:hypothetical protein COMA2_170068 [Candidatus Nitrospira nitrificans]|uniref:Uncharacterized protein n=1 Tax=Candidatus Nitrospira nitrificans TaxID=1742973 RepID=A0A0S4LCU2_9BACT|nr:hypothetical protein COMA2_170068 [Candidatus Nitrospira nitrificans]